MTEDDKKLDRFADAMGMSRPMVKLSSFQLKALRAIKAHGGEIVTEGGGYWKGADGCRLEIEPEPNSSSGIVGTRTIYALEDRGLLERTDARKLPSHRAPRRLTEDGRAAAFQL